LPSAAFPVIEGGGEAFYPLHCSLVKAEQAATLSQHFKPVPLYLVALTFHSQAEYLLSGKYRRPALPCYALLNHAAHIAPLLTSPRSLY
jgi:hypothetical protein